jgi:hypothetical protein
MNEEGGRVWFFGIGLTREKKDDPDGVAYVNHHRLGVIVHFGTEAEKGDYEPECAVCENGYGEGHAQIAQ